jgi:alkanesulfonate monooxygenase SsuD/methylene tetrahydromethanopterin reductase-like flavin-dependent oxidoreductase (luciferase family)
MHFGFGASNFELIDGQSLPAAHREMLEQAVLAEELGFDSVWVAEQHFSPERQCPSPFLIGTAIALRTGQIKIGVYTTMTFAHPIRLAEDAAVLDILSGGRLILCAGTGYRKEEFAAYGTAAEGKRSRIRETLEIMRLAWKDEPFVYRGKHFTIPAAPSDDTTGEEYPPLSVFPKPIQISIPIWMAAFGNVGVRQAGRLGLPLFTSPLESIPQLKERDSLYRTALQEAGQRQTLFPLIRSIYVAETAEQARADTEVALLAQARRYSRWRPQAAIEEAFEQVTADRFIIGDPDHCAAQIQRYVTELGINYIVCRMNLAGLAHTRVLASIRLFAQEVIPRLV